MRPLESTEATLRARATTIRALKDSSHLFSLYREQFRAAIIGGGAGEAVRMAERISAKLLESALRFSESS
jgi:hypothetical protein